jgi:EAL domain-containing protein (putative c-di-GMP-specific phosphodiesterase class I)
MEPAENSTPAGALLAFLTPDPEVHRDLAILLSERPLRLIGLRVLVPMSPDIGAWMVRTLGPEISMGRFHQVKVLTISPEEAGSPFTDERLAGMRTLQEWLSIHEDAWIMGVIDQKRLNVLFAPIVDIYDMHVTGYEALIRGIASDGTEIDARSLFETARRQSVLPLLDRAAIGRALEVVAKSDLPGLLFFNVDPQTLLENGIDAGTLRVLCHSLGISPDRIVIDLTHASDVTDVGEIMAVLEPFRELGIQISLDDLGAGIATFDLLVHLPTHFAKLHEELVRHADEDPARLKLLGLLSSLCSRANVQCIAEGLGSAQELEAVASVGIQYAQGWYFGRPQAWEQRSLGSLRETTRFKPT